MWCWCVVYSVPVIGTDWMVSVYIIPSTPYWLGRIGVKHKSTDSVTVISSDWMVSVYIIPSTSYWLDRVGVVLKSTDWVPVISSDWMVLVYPPAGRGDGAQWCARTISASLLTSCYVPSSYLPHLPVYLLMSKLSSVLFGPHGFLPVTDLSLAYVVNHFGQCLILIPGLMLRGGR